MTTTTNTAQGLLADIIEHPEDDDLRLIFADWLDDHDEEERAEFIRVQVELDSNGSRAAECGRDAFHKVTCRGDVRTKCERSIYLKQREKATRDNVKYSYSCRNENLWAGEGLIRLKDHGANWLFHRGFVAEVHAPLAVLQQHLPALVRQHPIERVRATDKEPYGTSSGPFSKEELGIAWHRRSRFLEGTEEGDELPDDLYELLPSERENDERWGKYYPTAEAAHEALSVALLKLARG